MERGTTMNPPGPDISNLPHLEMTTEPTNTAQSQGGNMGERVGSGVRGVFAGIHGAGEWLRGGINAAIDRTFGSEEGVTRNEAIARAGQQEISSGRFSRDNHEGAWNNSRRG
ncbi:hypothetical protein BJY00DRAFT_200458 [Aspergillus carlsbadensis]|nr:hypothetical protein BJY00DRAFT_200458 [Aspergillus carlsbadensis]